MKGIWAVAVLTMRDGIRGKAWVPFCAGILFCAVILLGSFGWNNIVAGKLHNAYSDNIVSSIFNIWSLGTVLTVLWVASTSFPRERRTPTLFTLPLARWEIALGKLIGVQILAAGFLAVGYGLSAALMVHSGSPLLSYSLLGFATALTLSFLYGCLSIPLGIRMSPIVAGVTTMFVVGMADLTDLLKNAHYISSNGFVWMIEHLFPWRIPGDPTKKIFYSGIPWSGSDYAGLLINAAIGVAFFVALNFLMRRDELSLK